MLYRTRDGDVLDKICWDYYQRTRDIVEIVLEVNPGLADLGPVFPAGILVELPDVPMSLQKNKTLRLWD
jgi:phage tail protein X